jgi:hypothetical protein
VLFPIPDDLPFDLTHAIHLIDKLRNDGKLKAVAPTEQEMKEYFEEQHITSPEVAVMVSGDWWSSKDGFHIAPNSKRFFEERVCAGGIALPVGQRMLEKRRVVARRKISPLMRTARLLPTQSRGHHRVRHIEHA